MKSQPNKSKLTKGLFPNQTTDMSILQPFFILGRLRAERQRGHLTQSNPASNDQRFFSKTAINIT